MAGRKNPPRPAPSALEGSKTISVSLASLFRLLQNLKRSPDAAAKVFSRSLAAIRDDALQQLTAEAANAKYTSALSKTNGLLTQAGSTKIGEIAAYFREQAVVGLDRGLAKYRAVLTQAIQELATQLFSNFSLGERSGKKSSCEASVDKHKGEDGLKCQVEVKGSFQAQNGPAKRGRPTLAACRLTCHFRLTIDTPPFCRRLRILPPLPPQVQSKLERPVLVEPCTAPSEDVLAGGPGVYDLSVPFSFVVECDLTTSPQNPGEGEATLRFRINVIESLEPVAAPVPAVTA